MIDHNDWPVHQPGPADAPIPGVHWYAGCDPDMPRVDPETGRCESCGGEACIECGRENCPDHQVALYRLRVEGIESRLSPGAMVRSFDETYGVVAEHPAHAVERLTHEVEWGILDTDHGFTITFLPNPEVCADCGKAIEIHESGLCDSCETARAYDRASEPA